MTMSAFDIGLVGFGVDGLLNGFYVGTGRPEFNAYAAVVGVRSAAAATKANTRAAANAGSRLIGFIVVPSTKNGRGSRPLSPAG